MRVPIYERKGSINPLRGGEVSAVAPAGDYGAEAAKTANAFLLKFQQIQNDTEDARTLELLNKFKTDSNNYHENPDNGAYNTRLGINAQGFYSEADKWLRERGEKYAQELKSERAKKNFRDKALEYINQKGVQNSRFEADQVKKYQTEQADASILNSLEFAEKNWDNPEAVNQSRGDIAQALELKMRGASKEAFTAAYNNYENKIGVARLRQAYTKDPLLAVRMIADPDIKLNSETRAKLIKSLGDKTEIYEIQAVAQEYAKHYNKENAFDMYNALISRYGADKGEKYFNAVRHVWSIAEGQKTARENALKIQANEKYEQGVLGLEVALLNGEDIPKEKIIALRGQLKTSDYDRLIRIINNRDSEKAKAEKAIREDEIFDYARTLSGTYPLGQEEYAYEEINKMPRDEAAQAKKHYDMFISEQRTARQNQENAIKARQKENFSKMERDYYDNLQIIPEAVLREKRNNGEISDEQYQNALTRNGLYSSRGDIEEQMRRQDPEWFNKTPQEQDMIIMNQKGVSEAEHEAAFNYLKQKAQAGELSETETNEYFENFWITKSEREELKEYGKKLNETHKKTVQDVQRNLSSAISATAAFSTTQKSEYQAAALNKFTELVGEISFDDPDYHEKVKKAGNTAYSFVTGLSGQSTEEPWFLGLLGSLVPTEFGENVQRGQELISNTPTNEPKIKFSPLNMVSGGRITGRFSDWRAYRKGQHNGIDIKAKEGTPIKSEDFGIPLKVFRIRTGSPSAGNYVVLKGVYPNGSTIEAQINHMQDNSIAVKEGDTVYHGDIIGKVGNTGHSTGSHMDLKIKINGKHVDPETWQPPVNLSENSYHARSIIDMEDSIPALESILFNDWSNDLF